MKDETLRLQGIDVSHHNGNINWNKVDVDFAIIRLGYGDNSIDQDDGYFINNINGCINNGIPFGFYIYSYATSLTGKNSIESEIEHTKRLLKRSPSKPFCVYIDMEDNKTSYLGKSKLTSFAIKFCKEIEAAGYKAGVYANQYWFNFRLDAKALSDYGYSLWVARYSDTEPNIGVDYDIWQKSSVAKVSGITGLVDLDLLYNTALIDNVYVSESQNKQDCDNKIHDFKITYQTWDDIENAWLPNVVNNNDYAGIFGHDVCCVYASSSVGNVYYRVHYKEGTWLPEVKNRDDYAGLYDRSIDGFAIKSDSAPLSYRVHLRNREIWLPYVTGYDIRDRRNGFAGIIGQEIDAIEIKPI